MRLSADQRRAALIGDGGYLKQHAKKVAGSLQLNHADSEDLQSDAALFICERYNIEAFDESLYPDGDEAFVLNKLKAHAGISLIRHLKKVQERRYRDRCRISDMEEPEHVQAPLDYAPDAEPEIPAHHEARLRTERMQNVLVLSDHPNAIKMQTILARVNAGESFETVTANVCPVRGESRRLFAWAKKTFEELIP